MQAVGGLVSCAQNLKRQLGTVWKAARQSEGPEGRTVRALQPLGEAADRRGSLEAERGGPLRLPSDANPLLQASHPDRGGCQGERSGG